MGQTRLRSYLYSAVQFPTDTVECEVVCVYWLLVFSIDSGLKFSFLLSEMSARFRASFQELHHAAESGGFSIPVLAAQVSIRIEPGIFYVGSLLAATQRMRHAMDGLQAEWVRRILGCGAGVYISWPLLRAQCGWALRLSSKIIESAVVALARLRLMPPDHPGARMLRLATSSLARTWLTSVRGLMEEQELPSRIPEIRDSTLFDAEELALAQSSSHTRRQILRRYRMEVVRPVLLERDIILYRQAPSGSLVFPGNSSASGTTFNGAVGHGLGPFHVGFLSEVGPGEDPGCVAVPAEAT